MERKNILLIVLIVLIAAGIFIAKRFLGGGSDCEKLSFSVSSQSIFVGESVHFEDNSSKSNEWNWNFGDGNGSSDQQSGDYTYTKSGTFDITLTVNGKCSEKVSIEVKDMVISSQDTTQKPVQIVGPSSCQVGENIRYGNATEGANSWEWQFGESGSIDAREQNPSYSYNKPGTYTIVLRVDASKLEGRHKITVLPKPAPVAPGAPKPAKITEQQLKAKFEKILDGGFSDIYYDMLKKHFCDNDHVKVAINGSKTMGIYEYCMKLNIQPNIKISEVKITFDKDCISNVSVSQN